MKIITTVGTSIFDKEPIKNYPALQTLKNDANKNRPYTEKHHVEDDFDEVLSKTNTFLNNKTLADLAAYSAECKTLHLIGEEKITEIVLFATDTVLGYLAGEILQTQLKRIFGDDKVRLERVAGLEVHNATTFQQIGFQNLVQKTSEAIRIGKNENKKVLLNISGGYKAILPVMTLVGQLEEVPLNYVYEDSETIIEIGNLPISFDTTMVELYFPYIQEIGNLSNAEFIRKNQTMLDEICDSHLIQKTDNGNYEISLLGNLFIEYLEKQWELDTKSNFSAIVEYKVFEYRVTNAYKIDNTVFVAKKRSKNLPVSDGVGVVSEIDILLQSNNHKFIDTEVKSALLLLSKTGMKKIKKQIDDRIRYYNGSHKLGELAEFHFVAYRLTKEGGGTTDKTIKERLKLLKTYVENKKIGTKNVVFKAFLINIGVKNIIGKRNNVFQDFLNDSLEKLNPLDLN